MARHWLRDLPLAWFFLGCVLPDLIDKPLYYGLCWFTGLQGAEVGLISGTRTLGHTGIFLFLVSLLALTGSRRFLALTLGLMTHILLDFVLEGMGLFYNSGTIMAFLFPVLGYRFSPSHYGEPTSHLMKSLSYVNLLISEAIGAFLLYAQWKGRGRRSSRKNRKRAATVILFACFGAGQVQGRGLEVDFSTSAWVVGATAVSYGALELAQPSLAPGRCTWCDRNPDGSDSLNGLDRGFRDLFKWSNEGTANSLSNVAAYGLLPLAAMGGVAWAASGDSATDNFGSDALVVAEATLAALNLVPLVKDIAGRERPAAHYSTAQGSTLDPKDKNVSFYSGHTSWAFSLAVAAGTVSYLRGYPRAPWVLGVGLGAASLVGYLRMAADRHYFTDVLVGAAIGSGIGFCIPYFFHRAEPEKSVRLHLYPGGLLVQIPFA